MRAATFYPCPGEGELKLSQRSSAKPVVTAPTDPADDTPSWVLSAAHMVVCTSRGVTQEARALVDEIYRVVTQHELDEGRKYARQGTRADTFRRTLEGFIGDLLRGQLNKKSQGWVYRSMRTESFTEDENVSYKDFKAAVDSLKKLELLELRPGYLDWGPGFDGIPFPTNNRKASRFRASPKLLALAETHGVTTAALGQHFILELPKNPLQLRATSHRNDVGAKVRGKRMSINQTEHTRQLEEQVRELNAFLDRHEFLGGVHRGFVRAFNNGDNPHFNWNKGGRLYSQGEDSYQLLSKDERLAMTIDGEAVSEIDIKASYLTIFQATCGEPLDTAVDPYLLPSLQDVEAVRGKPKLKRDLVKMWFVATFGSSRHLTRWPKDFIEDFQKEHIVSPRDLYKVRTIRTAAEVRYPLLKEWGKLALDWADLMFLESKAVLGTMLELMTGHGVPSLSVHDSLIVPQSRTKLAELILGRNYYEVVGVRPMLELHPEAATMTINQNNPSTEG